MCRITGGGCADLRVFCFFLLGVATHSKHGADASGMMILSAPSLACSVPCRHTLFFAELRGGGQTTRVMRPRGQVVCAMTKAEVQPLGV